MREVRRNVLRVKKRKLPEGSNQTKMGLKVTIADEKTSRIVSVQIRPKWD